MRIETPFMKLISGLFCASVLIFSACSTPTERMRPIPIAGGKILPLPDGLKGPANGKTNGYEERYTATVPVPNSKILTYKYAFTAPPGAKRENLVIDDISVEQAGTLYE